MLPAWFRLSVGGSGDSQSEPVRLQEGLGNDGGGAEAGAGVQLLLGGNQASQSSEELDSELGACV